MPRSDNQDTIAPTPAPARTPQDNDNEPRKPADKRWHYGNKAMQFADIRLPDKIYFGDGPYPGVILLHGGCWIRPYASLGNIDALADHLRDQGYMTINGEYHTADEEQGGWPGSFTDIALLIDSLPALAQDHPLDLDRLASLGHSAGGHLALWALARTSLPPASPLYRDKPVALKGAVILGGPGDLAESRADWIKGCGQDTLVALLGGPAVSAETFEKRLQQASPVHLLPFAGKQIFITGDHDPIVPARHGHLYVEKTVKAGSDAVHIDLKNRAHHDYLNPHDKDSQKAISDALRSIFTP